MILTTEQSGGGQNARDERPGLRVHKVQTQVGSEVNKVPKDVSQVQQPLLEHGEDAGTPEVAGMNRRLQEDQLLKLKSPLRSRDRRTTRIVRNGLPTNELVLSAFPNGNDRAFPEILQLYVSPGSVVADITYGQGVFWRHVPPKMYEVRATDIQDGVDCRNLPYKDGEIDCVVFDPPYMHTPGGTAHVSHKPFEKHYRNNGTGNQTESKYHDAVLDLYKDGGLEAYRVLKERGVLIVKCQDEVCANRQKFTHIEIITAYEKLGYIAEDLFVIVRNNRPGVSRMVRQVHARKNHSYFLVFWKRGTGKGLWEPPK